MITGLKHLEGSSELLHKPLPVLEPEKGSQLANGKEIHGVNITPLDLLEGGG